MEKIKIGIIGVGNCASSLIQGLSYYKDQPAEEVIGLMHWNLGGYKPSDIEVVLAFDIDKRKIGRDVAEAIFEKPNCTKVFATVDRTGVDVKPGVIADGVSVHLEEYDDDCAILPDFEAEATRGEVIQAIRDSGVKILLNYIPVGSEDATKFYAQCALDTGVAFINCIPVFIASDPDWAARFKEKGIPIVGDDIKSQVGATILHRVLANLFQKRGVKLERTYQFNVGGNGDFLNMLNRARLVSKKRSKTEAVQSILTKRLPSKNIHIGPSDYAPWLKDNKICFVRMEGLLFGNVPMNLELRLSVEDSPNSAGVVIDAIRCCQLAIDRGIGGSLCSPSSFFFKHPPKQVTDDEAYKLTEEFIAGRIEN